MVNEYRIGENQEKNYSFLIDLSADVSSEALAKEDQHIRFYVERNARLVVEMLMVSTANVHVECILQGEGADARIMGAYILDASHAGKITTVQEHAVANARSTLVMKGVLRDNAQAQYHGTIRVAQQARGTCASQENKNILLSNNARAVSVPSIEVLAHDVQCSHGSAVGRFDEEQLFYAAARGIDEKTAQKLLLQAFFADLFMDRELNEKVQLLIG